MTDTDRVTETDPSISAVVAMAPESHMGHAAKVKQALGRLGFEVHAPLHQSFSILAKQSVFERVFSVKLDVDAEAIFPSITVEGGSLDLPVEALPEEAREQVDHISFMAPPDLPGS